MENVILSPAQKALNINLHENIYGTFSEIGAGQEVVRHFFRAGGASGTIAKAMSAYDMDVSDAIYGKEKGKRRPKFRVNSIYGMSLAVENGAGLASLPDYMVADKPHLVRVLPNIEGPSYQTYFVYTEEFKNDRRLELFRDFLYNEAKDWRY